MKSTSWTRQEAARQKCPKRFFLHYLDPSSIATPYRNLKSIREMGGHIVHVALASVVRSVANGSRVSDHEAAAEKALQEFDRIVEDSVAQAPGFKTGNLQIAEIFNGVEASEEIEHWRVIIPLCVENGLRAMHTFALRSNAGEYGIIEESEIRFQRSGREYRGLIDLLICEGKNRTVVDWKCHSIENSDLRQIRFYQEYLAKSEGVPHSRLFGFAVDLLREEIIEAHYRPLEFRLSPRQRLESSPGLKKDPYPARPSHESCGRCPFATICQDSLVRTPHLNAPFGGLAK